MLYLWPWAKFEIRQAPQDTVAEWDSAWRERLRKMRTLSLKCDYAHYSLMSLSHQPRWRLQHLPRSNWKRPCQYHMQQCTNASNSTTSDFLHNIRSVSIRLKSVHSCKQVQNMNFTDSSTLFCDCIGSWSLTRHVRYVGNLSSFGQKMLPHHPRRAWAHHLSVALVEDAPDGPNPSVWRARI